MSLVKYNLLDPLKEFRVLSDNIFQDFFNDIDVSTLGKGFPVYDQYSEKDGTVVLEFALAGYLKEELMVSIEGNKLTISAQRNTDRSNVKTVSAIAKRSFSKTLTVAEDLDLEKVEASYSNGLLQVRIPTKQTQASVAKSIEIK